MGDNLVIVESPAKAKTIEKFLGKDFIVKSSFGHIRDLSKKNLGININNGFEPDYQISEDKKKIVSELKAAAKKADMVWLASDEDREGEAIAWHLFETLKLKEDKTKRIVFHEITKDAILNAIENPRSIDMNLVMAQQARRVLDRLVGFELSPVLWKKVAPKLSAGRVQSVAVRLIVDREREILHFNSIAYYKVTAYFHPENTSKSTKIKTNLEKTFATKAEAEDFLKKCINADFKILKIETKDGKRSPAAPFTTSSLQQEASRKLSFSVSQTMSVAQKLYESGHITYMRTDSTNLSNIALATSAQYITANFGKEYSKTRTYKTKSKGAQEAHEAIRPTYPTNATISGTNQEQRLYELIWKRTIASQMADAKIEKTNITIGNDNLAEHFKAQAEQIKFDGFLKLYIESHDEENETEEENTLLPLMSVGQNMEKISIDATERFSQRPARYSEASLVKKLEELGIGRPSTYAPTISTIGKRGYIIKDDREGVERIYTKLSIVEQSIKEESLKEITGTEKSKLFPEDIGILVTDFLYANFSNILDYGFTAKVEGDFDKVAEGKLIWNETLKVFYEPFHTQVEETVKDVGYTNTERVLGNDPVSGKIIKARLGRFGPLVQKGESDDTEKQYVSLKKGQLLETISLDEALKLFDLPRTLGEFEEEKITVAIGRFGPYAKIGKSFVSLGKLYDPYTISLDEAIELIIAHRKKEAEKFIKIFEEEGIEILNGRYGPYIKSDGKNYKIPKDKNAKELELKDCLEIINAPSNPKSKIKTRKSK